ncbi:hypothetical protein GGR06_001584 [Bacteroides reticulotermitis]|uniref:Uncharacterized protein n=1 Tax=Bacteroides reticulotermitis TaxID=1133319 RepID=A0A840D089_9BACE|nr:hypothetical protein [Bacteroides reticulotermitis]
MEREVLFMEWRGFILSSLERKGCNSKRLLLAICIEFRTNKKYRPTDKGLLKCANDIFEKHLTTQK